MQQLALEVGRVDHIEVDDADLADAGRGEVHGRGRAEAAGAQEQDAGVEELALAGAADLGEDQVPGVPGDLVGGEASGLSHLLGLYPGPLWAYSYERRQSPRRANR